MENKDLFLEKIDLTRIPRHIGIIMDGNGRWAKNRLLPRTMGHKEGANRVLDIVEASYKLGVKSLSLYAFSTENWKRPEDEVNKIMKLLVSFIKRWLEKIKRNNIRIQLMGEVDRLPDWVKKEVEIALLETCKNDKMILNIGLNYGGQDEIKRAAKLIAIDYKDSKISLDEIGERFESYLYTAGQAPLDLLIRPSGEMRVSNFMLYQLAYSEFWFSDVLWPDFTEEVLYKAIYEYQNRNRRFGGL